MSDQLPNGWRKAKLGEICREDRVAIGNSDPAYATMPYLGLEHIESNRGRILVTEDEARQSDSKSNNFRFTAEHVLYGKLRPYLNKVALPEFSGRCTTEIIPLLPVGTDRRWLAWLLRQEEVVEHAMRGKTGSRMPRTSMRDFMQLPVAVPSLDEQRRIVARLEGHLATAERARSVALAQLAAIEAMPQALLRQIFPRSPSDALSVGWRWVKLGEVCDVEKGRTPKKSWYAPTGAWLVHYRDVAAHGITWTAGRNTFVAPEYESSLKKLEPRTVLVGADAHDPATIGKKVTLVDTVPPHASPAYFAGEMLGIQSNAQRSIEPAIVWHWLRSEAGYEEMQQNVSGGHLNVRPARNVRIPLPPVDQQRRIVRELDELTAATERARAAAQAQLNAIDALPTAALRLAFTL